MEIAGLIIKCSFAVIIGVCALIFLEAFIQTTIENIRRKKCNTLEFKSIDEFEKFVKELEKEQNKKTTTKKSTTKKKEEK